MTMALITEQEVIAIYEEHNIEITIEDAREDIEHMGNFPCSAAHARELVRGYAQQLRTEWEGDMREAATFELYR